jgi:hypothetical protein
VSDPLTQPYAPPQAPLPGDVLPRTRDPLGWALLALPVVGGLANAFIPEVGTFAAFATLIGTVVLIGVDAKRRGQRPGTHVIGAVLLWLIFYPLYMHRRAAWGAPKRLPFALVAAGLYLAGAFYQPLTRTPTRVYVKCAAAGARMNAGFDCSLEHTAGQRGGEACWDLVLTCANGPGGSAHACGRVAPGETAHVTIPYSSLQGASGCDKLTKIAVENAAVTSD